jgi:hypothetical protein
MSKFYYINNICDHDINVAGEILVVLDEDKTPVWHHDWSDSTFDFPDHLPRDLMKITGADSDSEFISIPKASGKLAFEVEKYLENQGYSIED